MHYKYNIKNELIPCKIDQFSPEHVGILEQDSFIVSMLAESHNNMQFLRINDVK